MQFIALHLLALTLGGGPTFAEPREDASVFARDDSTVSITEVAAVEALRLLRDPNGPSAQDLVADVAGLGPGLLPAIAGWLQTRLIPGHDGGTDMAVSVYQEELLLLSIEAWGPGPVSELLGETPPSEFSVGDRRVALQLLGASCGAGDLDRLIAFAQLEDEPSIPAALESVLEDAATRLLKRDPRAYTALEGLRQGDLDLLACFVVAIGNAGSPRGLSFLHETIAWKDDLAELILAQVRKIGPSHDAELNRRLAVAIRRYLDPGERGVCQAAILAVAELQDFDSMSQLIALLDEGDPGLAKNAHWALIRLSGQSLSPSADLWSRWLAREEAWFRREEYRAFKNLHSHDEGTVAKAIRSIASCRLNRHELALGLSEALSHPTERIRVLAIQGLGELGSPLVVPKLIGSLEDPRPAVVDAAWKTLVAIMGEDHGRDPETWRAAVEFS